MMSQGAIKTANTSVCGNESCKLALVSWLTHNVLLEWCRVTTEIMCGLIKFRIMTIFSVLRHGEHSTMLFGYDLGLVYMTLMVRIGQNHREPCQKEQNMYFDIDYGRDSIKLMRHKKKIQLAPPLTW